MTEFFLVKVKSLVILLGNKCAIADKGERRQKTVGQGKPRKNFNQLPLRSTTRLAKPATCAPDCATRPRRARPRARERTSLGVQATRRAIFRIRLRAESFQSSRGG